MAFLTISKSRKDSRDSLSPIPPSLNTTTSLKLNLSSLLLQTLQDTTSQSSFERRPPLCASGTIAALLSTGYSRGPCIAQHCWRESADLTQFRGVKRRVERHRVNYGRAAGVLISVCSWHNKIEIALCRGSRRSNQRCASFIVRRNSGGELPSAAVETARAFISSGF